MSVKSTILTVAITLSTIAVAYGASNTNASNTNLIIEEARQACRPPTQQPQTIELGQPAPDKTDPRVTPLNSVAPNQLGKAATGVVIDILRQDHVDKVKELVCISWLCRKTANITECLGNALLYAGSGLLSLSLPVESFSSREASKLVIFAGSACMAAHLVLIGFAKCSARETGERGDQLQKLALGFNVVQLLPQITSDEECKGDTK